MSKVPLKANENLHFAENGTTDCVEEDPRDRCCCNVHVETGAKIIAILGLIFCCLNFLANLLNDNYAIGNVGTLMAVLVYSCMLTAINNRNPGLYWPFLGLNGIGIILGCIALVLLSGLTLIEATQNFTYDNEIPLSLFLGIMVFLLVNVSLNIWFQTIVYRAYRYMRREQNQELPSTYIIQDKYYNSQ